MPLPLLIPLILKAAGLGAKKHGAKHLASKAFKHKVKRKPTHKKRRRHRKDEEE